MLSLACSVVEFDLILVQLSNVCMTKLLIQ